MLNRSAHKSKRLRILLLLAGLCVCCVSTLRAQNHPNSPVFKDYKQARQSPFVEQSDATYQIWEGFMLTRKASTGDMLAQHELGIRYLLGRGFRADTVKGAYWIRKAAERNLMPARFNLAILLFNGWGIDWNPFEAYQHFQYCADKGMVEAEYVMAQLFSENLVVSRDWSKAFSWVKKAADSGYEPAREVLGEFAKRASVALPDSSLAKTKHAGAIRDSSGRKGPGSSLGWEPVFLEFGHDTVRGTDDIALLKDVLQQAGPKLTKAFGMAQMLEGKRDIDSVELQSLEQASESGSPEALTVLGRCYEKGIVVKKNLVLASEYYIRAVRLGSSRAPELLWKLIQEKDYFPALKLRAAKDDPDAQFAWGSLTAFGFDPVLIQAGAFITPDQAVKLLTQSAHRGHRQALVELGLCCYSGRWVTQDVEKAFEYWKKAAALGSKDAQVRLAIARVRSIGQTGDREHTIDELRQAAEEGSMLAEVALGYCYETGNGVPQNKGEASKLYRSSAQRGSEDAYLALRRMYDEIRPPGDEFRLAER